MHHNKFSRFFETAYIGLKWQFSPEIHNNDIPSIAPTTDPYVVVANAVDRSSNKKKRRGTLPKNGEFRRHSVGFCRLGLCNIAPFWPVLKLTAVVSIKSVVSRGTPIAGMRFAL